MTQKLFLLFSIGRDRYALQASDVAVVLPLAQCKQVPGTPPWVRGLLSHGSRHVPVIDLTHLAQGQPSALRLSTRVVLVHYAPAGRSSELLGLVLEQAASTLRCDPDDFLNSGISNDEARYLGPVMHHHDGLLQWVKVDELLDDATRALLYPDIADVAGVAPQAPEEGA
ncbi:chemotaxis protein CheW [Herbaspirillum sp. LeCh32-8]|uniref:chemotaxis protein CheW n=1 Tax=Herbaspirillum sp. LeCh32-8 TaxID=2821356 RepID=UPI001AE4233A|nr:chemotaxis protein CheW [Herbaspirillum sp. LeCh32-8]MBP0599665.1 chemotaxis protein CheW [Herbaspirillum sp. LeCh32-8]